MSAHKEGLLRIPVIEWLATRSMTPVFETISNIDIVGVQWAPRIGRLIPSIELVCAVELKLHDFAGVFRQARTNRYYCHESWIAMPAARISRFNNRTFQKIEDAGIGLLTVDGEARVICGARRNEVELPCRIHRGLWRRRGEFVGRVATQRALEAALLGTLTPGGDI